MAEIAEGLKLFADFNVDCVVVGGVAAGARGSSQVTFDVDVCYSRERANLIRRAQALRSVNATLRGAPKDLPFLLDDETLRRVKIDILGEVQGVGDYKDCFQNSSEVYLFGRPYRVLSLEKLIAAKRAARRNKDLSALPELEAILEHRRVSEAAED